MKTLLVAGGAGFIGTNFVRHWHRRHPQDRIVVLDLLTYAGNGGNLDGLTRVELVQGDICDSALVERLMRSADVDMVVNFAAETHVDRSISDPGAFIRSNVTGTHSLLATARKLWLEEKRHPDRRFHQVSTDEVFGSLGPDEPAFNERTAHAPNSPYSASKAGADHLVRAYHRTYGLNVTTSHCSNNYGPYQYPEKLIPLFLANALEGRPLPVYGDGGNIRDWLFVEDHCHAIALILEGAQPGAVYTVGGGSEMSNIELVDRLCAGIDAAFARDPLLAARFPGAPAAQGRPSAQLKAFVPDRPGHDRRYAIDDARIRHDLGYRPASSFDRHFADTLQWYLDRPDWWRAKLSDAVPPLWLKAAQAG
ncbi:dTDP-glucose 4,6-dehydratase [Sphingobium sp. PNB]|uniref:dTDP-glucose 4,6-dehydratase n=1 Tax=Sphingobium sp. PNB TaxID=863934 RepID=UPI001CA45AEC|nr:dTDP-glucose 4,6-dehydratase [Sphingobium sp. PNB]MCB4858141.1 dTDP-glucose 4,6-dehydratase [Sphingobium sp. PNB]